MSNDVLDERFFVFLHLKGKFTTISILPGREVFYIDHNLRLNKEERTYIDKCFMESNGKSSVKLGIATDLQETNER